jgi:hypothetical protein
MTILSFAYILEDQTTRICGKKDEKCAIDARGLIWFCDINPKLFCMYSYDGSETL